jgi:hypothetical protein
VDDLFGAPAKPATPAPAAPEAPAAPAPAAPAKPAADDPFADPFKISADGQLPVRMWSDNTGTFQVEGRLIAILPDHVRLLKSNGRTTTVPKRRLSDADSTYVEEAAARHGASLIGQVAAK